MWNIHSLIVIQSNIDWNIKHFNIKVFRSHKQGGWFFYPIFYALLIENGINNLIFFFGFCKLIFIFRYFCFKIETKFFFLVFKWFTVFPGLSLFVRWKWNIFVLQFKLIQINLPPQLFFFLFILIVCLQCTHCCLLIQSI